MGRSSDRNAFPNADGAAYSPLPFGHHPWTKHRNFNTRFGHFLYSLACIDNAVTGSNEYHGPGNAYSWTWDTGTAGVYVAGDPYASYLYRDPAASESPGADSCAEYNGELHATCYVGGLGGCRQPGLV